LILPIMPLFGSGHHRRGRMNSSWTSKPTRRLIHSPAVPRLDSRWSKPFFQVPALKSSMLWPNLTPIWALRLPRLAKALRQSGVSVKTCSRLSYQELIRQIGEERPVILTLSNPKSESRHWVVAYGHGPDHIVLASNGLPWVHKKRFNRDDFLALWEPRGNGLICWAEVRRPRRTRSKGGSK